MIEGLIESVRFGHSSFGTVQPTPSTGPVQPQYQSGLPPGGLRFGRKIYGSFNSSTGNGVPQYQSGLPPVALRFGHKIYGNAPASTISGSGEPKYQSGLPPEAIRFGHKIFGSSGQVTPPITTPPPTVPPPVGGGVGHRPPPHPRGHYSPNALGRLRTTRDELPEDEIVVQPEVQVEPPKPKLTAPILQPLPIDFGKGRSAIIGIKRELERQHQELLADDEEAIIALILAALTNR